VCDRVRARKPVERERVVHTTWADVVRPRGTASPPVLSSIQTEQRKDMSTEKVPASDQIAMGHVFIQLYRGQPGVQASRI